MRVHYPNTPPAIIDVKQKHIYTTMSEIKNNKGSKGMPKESKVEAPTTTEQVSEAQSATTAEQVMATATAEYNTLVDVISKARVASAETASAADAVFSRNATSINLGDSLKVMMPTADEVDAVLKGQRTMNRQGTRTPYYSFLCGQVSSSALAPAFNETIKLLQENTEFDYLPNRGYSSVEDYLNALKNWLIKHNAKLDENGRLYVEIKCVGRPSYFINSAEGARQARGYLFSFA